MTPLATTKYTKGTKKNKVISHKDYTERRSLFQRSATEKHGKTRKIYSFSVFFRVIPWLKFSRLVGVGINVGILFSGKRLNVVDDIL